MIVQAVRCHACDDLVYSCARHDFRACTCKAVYIDGGMDYVRLGGTIGTFDYPVPLDLGDEVTATHLSRDYHSGKVRRKYGLIKKRNAKRYLLPEAEKKT